MYDDIKKNKKMGRVLWEKSLVKKKLEVITHYIIEAIVLIYLIIKFMNNEYKNIIVNTKLLWLKN